MCQSRYTVVQQTDRDVDRDPPVRGIQLELFESSELQEDFARLALGDRRSSPRDASEQGFRDVNSYRKAIAVVVKSAQELARARWPEPYGAVHPAPDHGVVAELCQSATEFAHSAQLLVDQAARAASSISKERKRYRESF